MAWVRLAAASLALAVPAALPAQSDAVPDDEALAAMPLDQRFATLLAHGRYLDAMQEVEAADPAALEPGARSCYQQMRPALDGFRPVDRAPPTPRPADPAQLAAYDGAVAEDAIAAIVERARDRRIVIVNEAHDSPRDRAFILKLAEALRPLGFTHYAAETLANYPPEVSAEEMGRLVRDGYPIRATGYYSDEPMHGYLVRRVLELGYRPVPYEFRSQPGQVPKTMVERVAERDQGQAENLARALDAAGPDAKFLIHVGYAHATERPLPDGSEWMAGRLARLTGLDPLTIDQHEVSEDSNAGLHRELAQRLGAGPAVFFKDGAAVGTGWKGETVDLQVVHPLVTAIDGRPDWLRGTGRVPVAIPGDLLPASGVRLVQVFVAGEADDAVPLDQALVTAGAEPPVLYAPEGAELRWAVQD